MVQNKQSFSTFPASLSSSFSSSPASSMVPPATPPPHSGIPGADQLPSPTSTTFKSIFGIPASGHRPHSSSSTLSMGQVVSRPQLTAPFSPSSAPSSLGVSSSNAGNRFKRAFGGRRKKSDTSAKLDKGQDSQADELFHGSTSGALTRQLGAKQITLQLAQQVFNKKSAPASPALSGLSLPPPPPPPKHAPIPSSSHLPPINTNIDKRISVMTTSSPIAPALDYMRKSDEHTEHVGSRVNERKDLERSETRDTRRKSDSTLSLHTIRPALGSMTPRPVSLASLQSTHTIVPVNKRLSALITDAEYVMAEEEDGTRNDERGRAFSLASPASSLRLRDRRSQSLTLGPPLALMVSGATTANAAMSMETITVTLPRSTSEGRERERLAAREVAMTTSASLPSQATGNTGMRHTNAITFLNQASSQAVSRVERTLPDLPDTPERTPSPQAYSPHPSFRQTAISMTSGFAPAAGLARRAVERMGRVWGSKSSFSSPLASPLGESSFNGRTGPPSRSSSSHSELAHHAHGRKVRHIPQTPSITSTTSSLSDHEGPWLGKCFRGPVRVSASGVVVGGLVFGRELNACVEETAIDSLLNVVRKNVAPVGGEQLNSVQRSRPSAPLESRHIPALVVRCVQHIFAWGIQEQGLFRVSGRSSHVAKLRSEFDTGADFDIVQSNPGDLDPHAVASVFKAYLRELPEPILTNQLLPSFDAALASERSTNGVQDPPPLEYLHQLRKPPSLSTLGMPNFADARPPSESLRTTFSTLISRLPQENRDLLLTVVEVINHTASRSSETKMPLSNLLLVLRPSLKMNPSLLQALCESQDIWSGVHPCKEAPDLDMIAGETTESSGSAETGVPETRDGVEIASPVRSSSDNKRFVRPLPSLPPPDDSTSSSPSELFVPPVKDHSGISNVALDAETSSSSFSATDDSSSISHLSQGGRPVTPTSLNFKLTNPHFPPSLSCSTDSLSVTSSSDSPMQLVKPLTLVDECSEQHSTNSPHSLHVAESIPLPIPFSRPGQTTSEPRFQFPGSRDSIARNPLAHRKSTPSVSLSSSISAEARAASMASRARRLKKPSLHLLFSKHSPFPFSSSPSQSPVISAPSTILQDGALRSSYASDSSPESTVTAPQSSRFSYPPVLNTAIDESSISLALGIEDEKDHRSTSVRHAAETDSQGHTALRRRSVPREMIKDAQIRHLDVDLAEDEAFGEYNWTQSVLMAAGGPAW